MKHTVNVSHRLVIDGQIVLSLIRNELARQHKASAVEPEAGDMPPRLADGVRLTGLVTGTPKVGRTASFDSLEITWED